MTKPMINPLIDQQAAAFRDYLQQPGHELNTADEVIVDTVIETMRCYVPSLSDAEIAAALLVTGRLAEMIHQTVPPSHATARYAANVLGVAGTKLLHGEVPR